MRPIVDPPLYQMAPSPPIVMRSGRARRGKCVRLVIQWRVDPAEQWRAASPTRSCRRRERDLRRIESYVERELVRLSA